MFAAGAFSSTEFSTSTGFLYTPQVLDLAAADDEVSSASVFESLSLEFAAGDDLFESRLPFSGNVLDASSVSQDTVTSATELISVIQEQAKVERVERYVGFGFATGGFASGSFSGLGDGTSFFGGDVFSASIEVGYTLSEGARVADQIFGRLALPAAFLDTASVVASIGAIPEYPGDISESATAAEVVSSIPEYSGIINEVVTASTIETTLVELGSVISEIVVGVDAPTSLFVVNSSVSETAATIDRPFTQYITRPVVVNMAQAQDTTEARLQWENISTFEVTNWVLIDTNK